MSKIKTLGRKGMITPMILMVLSVFFVFATSILSWSLSERKNVLRKERSTEALQIAEAGIDYYKWHLAHDDEDFKDGNAWCCDDDGDGQNEETSTPASCGGKCGPYVESYKDYDGNVIGEFRLFITPPVVGSTIMTVESIGKSNTDANVDKKVKARLGKRSLATYSLLGNSPIWIGDTESTSGPLHANGGIRFDGTCNSEVTSAAPNYDAGAAHHGASGTHPGIWGSAAATCQQYWSFPEPAIDFDLFTLDMVKIGDAANAGGIYLGVSGKSGYKLVFRSDAKIDIYKVNSVTNKVKYYNDAWLETDDYEEIQSTTFMRTENMPANGVLFAKDSVWVEGTVNGRVTVAASRLTETVSNYGRIIINGDINYLARNGQNVLGLMAEGDILVPKHAPTDLTIDAVMLSQKGHVYRRDYKSHGVKDSIEVYGGIITNLFWTWSWVDGGGHYIDGYVNTSTVYDNYLTFGPPPMFPTTENFEVISYNEDK